MSYIFEEDGWRREYQNPAKQNLIWIYILFSNESVVFLDDFNDWLTVENYCNEKDLKITEIGLQYATNRITETVSNADGVYLIRSLRADFGSKPKQCYTIGIVSGNKVKKKTWIVPELVFSFSSNDEIENCFEEAIVYHDKKRKAATI